MTVFVKESSKSVLSGLSKMKAAMIEDYNDFPVNDGMKKEYAEDFTITYGKKYIKIVRKNGGVMAFVVGVDNDKKFKKGDILKPAGWAAPARNFARGNVLEGGYEVRWTGAG